MCHGTREVTLAPRGCLIHGLGRLKSGNDHMSDNGFNCGNCGAELPLRFRHARMMACTHCGSASVLRDRAFELAGTGGVMDEAPSLIHLDREVIVRGLHLIPVGHARFDYGRGWWDEYWCLRGGTGEDGCWLSVDEGDYALEWPLEQSDWPDERTLALNQSVTIRNTDFIVTEAESATCLAVRGAFPEVLDVGEAHLYFDLSAQGGGLATYETWEGGRGWSLGTWVDPWEVRSR